MGSILWAKLAADPGSVHNDIMYDCERARFLHGSSKVIEAPDSSLEVRKIRRILFRVLLADQPASERERK
ncbi:hypothetical protein [Microvirga lotononidis]|uniref:hypothetical protein n=1 Tax=Microvirga lotononidis TaxID=864069 RepID=UPI0003059F70|nr:hypothetical protein [Microvirga lotononidis]